MGADLSGVRFDARADITKVVQQQGRVVLDSDGNEQVDLLDRRLRAHAADLGSPGGSPDIAGTAVIPRTTPDAFRLTFAGGDLQLGRGRMYVDGVLAENHGTGAEEFDPLLGELRGAADTPYLDQPYWPSPDPLPGKGRHLVYLEVRERELTWVEEPDLVDPAIALDTCARTQVIWQVRVHTPAATAITCATPDQEIPGWAAVIAPSRARLSVGTVAVPPALDPCSLPPSGDYRGLENQTYRVEIHAGGAGGTATFKWSRDNGSVTVPVTEVTSTSRLRLASLGKDADALGLASGQWVEITDDVQELAGRPGEMRQVTVHPEDRSVSFSPALPMTAEEAASRHLRVRRWDGAGGTTTIPATATAVELEHGITVTLTATGATFRTGDHWIFTARTATSTVQQLDEAPPLGPRRHFARLGIIEDGTVISDQCAPLWPADCEDDDCACTVCVSPEDHAEGTLTIQDGLDQVAATGGTVCLGVGTYQVKEPLRVTEATGVRLRGQGPGTLVIAQGDALVIESSVNTGVEDLRIVSAGQNGVGPTRVPVAGAAIRLVGCYGTTLAGLDIQVKGNAGDEQCGIALNHLCVTLLVRDNDIVAPVGLRAAAGIKAPLLLDDVAIERNRFDCASFAVLADAAVLCSHDVQVRENHVEVGTGAGVQWGGVVGDDAAVGVVGNHVTSGGDGIVVTGGVTVTGNTVRSAAGEKGRWFERDTDGERTGIWVHPSELPGEGESSVVDNSVTGFQRAITVEGAGGPLRVSSNEVARCRTGIGVEGRVVGLEIQVCDNVVRDIGGQDNRPGTFGVLVTGARTALVAHNTVGEVGAPGEDGGVVGIGVLGVAACRLIGNSVHAVGSTEDGGQNFDYWVGAVQASTIQGNQSFHDPDTAGQRAYGLWFQTAGLRTVRGLKAVAGETKGGQVLFATDDLVLLQTVGEREGSVVVGDNTFTGTEGGAAVVLRLRTETLQFSHNHCTCPGDTRGAVQIAAYAAAVTGNRVMGGTPSMLLQVPGERLTVLGNLVSDRIEAHPELAEPWVPLNLEGVS